MQIDPQHVFPAVTFIPPRNLLHLSAGDIPLETRWIFARALASRRASSVDKALERLSASTKLPTPIYQFFWGEFCDWYLEIVKLRLNFGESDDTPASAAALATLVAVFEGALRLLSPFMPFLAEELWHALYDNRPPFRSIALRSIRLRLTSLR